MYKNIAYKNFKFSKIYITSQYLRIFVTCLKMSVVKTKKKC